MLKPLLTLALLLPAITHARIGETPEECAKRYGEPFERKGGAARSLQISYKGGMETTCHFAEGKCVAIHFRLIAPVRADFQDTLENLPPLGNSVVALLLDANKGDSEWEAGSEKDGASYFKTKDGSRRAFSNGVALAIQTSTDIETRKNMVEPAVIKEAIKGF